MQRNHGAGAKQDSGLEGQMANSVKPPGTPLGPFGPSRSGITKESAILRSRAIAHAASMLKRRDESDSWSAQPYVSRSSNYGSQSRIAEFYGARRTKLTVARVKIATSATRYLWHVATIPFRIAVVYELRLMSFSTKTPW